MHEADVPADWLQQLENDSQWDSLACATLSRHEQSFFIYSEISARLV